MVASSNHKLAAVVTFLATGHWLSVGVQYLVFSGAGEESLVVLAYSCLMPFAFFVDTQPLCHTGKLVCCGVLDMCAMTLFAVSLERAGSAYHTVIYASITIFVALLRRLLGRFISPMQWCGVVAVVAGLALTVLNVESDNQKVHMRRIHQSLSPHLSPHHNPMVAAQAHDSSQRHLDPGRDLDPLAGGSDSELVTGMLLSICCVVTMACVYTVDEWVQMHQPRPSDLKFVWMIGLVQTVLSSVYVVTYTIPQWDVKVTRKMESAEEHLTYAAVAAIYASIAVSNMVHMLSFFWIMRSTEAGGVLIGVLQGARVLIVTLYGSAFLCSQQTSQCLSSQKVAALVVITAGVMLFSLADKLQGSWPRCMERYVSKHLAAVGSECSKEELSCLLAAEEAT